MGQRPTLRARPTDFAGALNDRSGPLAAYIACKNRGTRFTRDSSDLKRAGATRPRTVIASMARDDVLVKPEEVV
jgi:hypothetical protein